MSPAIPLLLALGLGLVAWLAARSKAWALKRAAPPGTRAPLHSLPNYHGWYVALWAAVPAMLFALVWNAASPGLILAQVIGHPAAASLPPFGIERDSTLAEAYAVAAGTAFGAFNPAASGLVAPFREAIAFYGTIGIVVTLLLGFVGGAYGFLKLRADFTARTRVERAVMIPRRVRLRWRMTSSRPPMPRR